MTFSETVVAMLVANGLTLLWCFCLWRIGRDEKDLKAMFGFLAVCAIGLLFVFSSAQ